jgi:hypothetical protein
MSTPDVIMQSDAIKPTPLNSTIVLSEWARVSKTEPIEIIEIAVIIHPQYCDLGGCRPKVFMGGCWGASLLNRKNERDDRAGHQQWEGSVLSCILREDTWTALSEN